MRAKISSPDKLLFPADGVTKADLASYYERVAEWIVPHVRERPLSLQIFPDGIEGKGFFQKNVPKHYPDWIRRVEVRKEGGTVIIHGRPEWQTRKAIENPLSIIASDGFIENGRGHGELIARRLAVMWGDLEAPREAHVNG